MQTNGAIAFGIANWIMQGLLPAISDWQTGLLINMALS